jgi:hypothetical protein
MSAASLVYTRGSAFFFASEDWCTRHATKQDRTSGSFEVVELAVFLQESKDDTLYQISSRFPIAGTVADCVICKLKAKSTLGEWKLYYQSTPLWGLSTSFMSILVLLAVARGSSYRSVGW